jgi:hypothetical protein
VALVIFQYPFIIGPLPLRFFTGANSANSL